MIRAILITAVLLASSTVNAGQSSGTNFAPDGSALDGVSSPDEIARLLAARKAELERRVADSRYPRAGAVGQGADDRGGHE
jgi:hypothetical protein